MPIIAGWREVAAPIAEPISTAEAKLNLRVDYVDEDTRIVALIKAARLWCENWTNRTVITRAFDLYLRCFPCGYIELIPGGVTAVTSLVYTDTAAAATTWTASGADLVSGATTMAHVDTISDPGRIVLAHGQSWPTATLRTMNPIAIRFTAGYADAASVPEPIKQAMHLLVAHWFRNREAVLVGNEANVSQSMKMAVESLLSPYKIWTF